MPEGPNAAARSAGFTVLEAMVAIVVFAGAAMALYGLFNTNLIALGRVQDTSRQLTAARHALAHLAAVNPRQVDSGRIRVNGFDIFWTARLLEPVRRSRTVSGNEGYFEIGLYEVEFELRDAGRSLDTWRVRLPGYEKVQEPVP